MLLSVQIITLLVSLRSTTSFSFFFTLLNFFNFHEGHSGREGVSSSLPQIEYKIRNSKTDTKLQVEILLLLHTDFKEILTK